MKIEELKKQIEQQTLNDLPLIFVCKRDNFIAHQYIEAISKFKNLQIKIVEEEPRSFLDADNDTLYLMYVDGTVSEAPATNNLIVIAEKVSKKLELDRTVEIPKLEDWEIKDYACQKLSGLKESEIDTLLSLTKDEYRIFNEIDKLSIFPVGAQSSVFNECIQSGFYSDLNLRTIFDFTNAIFNRDKETINKIYPKLKECDIEPMSFYAVVYNNIRNMIMVSMQKYPNEENTGLKQNQIYAISKSAKRYNREQLLKLFHIVSSVDNMCIIPKIVDDRLFNG